MSAMRHLLQKTSSDCGITTFAMLADYSHRQAVKLYPARKSRVTFAQMSSMLGARYKGQQWRVRLVGKGQTIETMHWPECRLAALVRGPAYSHWLAVYFGFVCDPEIETFHLGSEHPRRDWKVSKLLIPADPEAIEAIARSRVGAPK